MSQKSFKELLDDRAYEGTDEQRRQWWSMVVSMLTSWAENRGKQERLATKLRAAAAADDKIKQQIEQQLSYLGVPSHEVFRRPLMKKALEAKNKAQLLEDPDPFFEKGERIENPVEKAEKVRESKIAAAKAVALGKDTASTSAQPTSTTKSKSQKRRQKEKDKVAKLKAELERENKGTDLPGAKRHKPEDDDDKPPPAPVDNSAAQATVA